MAEADLSVALMVLQTQTVAQMAAVVHTVVLMEQQMNSVAQDHTLTQDVFHQQQRLHLQIHTCHQHKEDITIQSLPFHSSTRNKTISSFKEISFITSLHSDSLVKTQLYPNKIS
jgi:hypothetical protein